MSNVDIDLAVKDELPQTFTTQDVEDIKSAIDVPRANVYVKPYEIYDEDGVEQVVGEVRKTIDGVKKKKPLYRKRLDTSFTSSSYSNIAASLDFSTFNIERIRSIDGMVYSLSYHQEFAIEHISPSPNLSDRVTVIYTEDSKLLTINAGGWGPCDAFVIIEYTKTTDEWQEVVE